jgi:hypothetical protein
LRIVFDKNVPVGVRRFLSGHEVRTFVEMLWHPQLENGELLDAAEALGFDVMVTSDQNREEARSRRARVQYLARRAGTRSGDRGQSCGGNAGQL